MPFPGSMPNGTRKLGLFEPEASNQCQPGTHFSSEVALQKGFVRFAFDPDLEYKVATQYGECALELDGDPGTSFTLTQS